MSKAIIAIGIPGSGKSTFMRPLAETENLAYVNADDIRHEITGSSANHRMEQVVWETLFKRVASSLADKGVVIDATHARKNDRMKTVSFCKEHGAEKIIGYWFVTPLEICKQRNEARPRVVKPAVLDTMHRRLQSDPPNLDEGFDELLKIDRSFS
jgi:predicted kinase